MRHVLRNFLICGTMILASYASMIPAGASASVAKSAHLSFSQKVRCFLDPRPDFWKIPATCDKSETDNEQGRSSFSAAFEVPSQGKSPLPSATRTVEVKSNSFVGLSRAEFDAALLGLRAELLRAMPAYSAKYESTGQAPASYVSAAYSGGYSVPPPNTASTDYVNAQVGAVPQPWTNDGSALYTTTRDVSIGTTTRYEALNVDGAIYLANMTAPTSTSNRLYANAGDLYYAGNLIGGATTGVWASDGTNVYRTSGNVGIGTSTPAANLSIQGTSGQSNSFVALSASSTAPAPFFEISSTTVTNIVGRAIDPTLVATISDGAGSAPYLPYGAKASFVQGNYLYLISPGVGGQYGTLEIMDISDPQNPVHVGALQGVDSTPYVNTPAIYVSGNYAYIALDGYDSSLNIVDISNPANPIKVGSYFNAGLRQPGKVIVSGKYAYVAYSYGNSLGVIDVSNPGSPTLAGSITNSTYLNNVHSIALSGSFVYAQGVGSYLSVIDVSNPRSPIFASNIANGTNGAVLGGCYGEGNLSVSGNYLYVGCDQNTSLNIFDISDRRSPVLKSVTTIPGRAGNNQVSGKYLYSISINSVFTVTDVSNPISPRVLMSKTLPISAPGGWIQGLVVSGNYAYVGTAMLSGGGRQFIVDIGGAYVSNEEVGSSKIGNLQVLNSAKFNQGISVVEGLNVGGNTLIGGSLSITGLFGTTTSTTTTSGNPSLSVGGSFAAQSAGTESIFQLIRPLSSGVSYAQVASFQVGSYATNGAGNGYGPSTRLDINLKAAANGTISGDTNVMTLLSSKMVGIGTTSPSTTLFIQGTGGTNPFVIASSTGTQMLTFSQSGNLGFGSTNPGSTLSGPLTGTFSISASSPVQAVTATAGNSLTLSAANAIAGSGGGSNAAVGGSVTIVGGTGAQSTVVSGANGGSVSITGGSGGGYQALGGNVNITGGSVGSIDGSAGGNVNIASGNNVQGGSSGNISITTPTTLSSSAGSIGSITIAVGDSNNSTGAVGDLLIRGGAHNFTYSSVNSGGALRLTTQKGGNNNGASGTGGNGGLQAITLGSGGAASGSTAATGGNGGAWTVAGAAGGNASGSGGTQLGGNGSTLTLTSGAGGNASGASGTRTGGNSGNIVLDIAAAGTGSSANGSVGSVLLAPTRGSVGIGTTTPSAQLTNTGTVRFAALGSGGASLITDALGNVTVSSDERLKDIQGDFEIGLEQILKIDPVTYKWKSETGYDATGTYAGFSAQNVQGAIPEAVTSDSKGFLTLADRPIIAALVNAVKELALKIAKIPDWFAAKDNNFCIDDVCVTKDEFKSMLLKSKSSGGNPVIQSVDEPLTNPTPSTEPPAPADPIPSTPDTPSAGSDTLEPDPAPVVTEPITPPTEAVVPEPVISAPEPVSVPAPEPALAPAPAAE